MLIKYYPNSDEPLGQISRVFEEVMDKHKDLWVLTKEILEKIHKSSNLELFKRQRIVERLHNVDEPIFELRIPPGKRRAGVLRIYFAYKKGDNNTIHFLSGELKRGKANKGIIKTAEKRYREVCYENQ